MKITSYIHPIRTYLPCTGIGRHTNQILLNLSTRKDINLQLLFSQQWLGNDSKLSTQCPLRDLPFNTFPYPENLAERSWKLLGLPKLDHYIPEDTDWVYAPMETYLPVSKCPIAITLHDIQAFEPNLPWSNTWHHRWFAYKWSKWVSKALKDSRIVFTVSQFSKQRMVELLGADANKIIVVGNGVEQCFFDISSLSIEDLTLPVDFPYALVVGGLKYRKGADAVVAVARALQKTRSELKIVVIGQSETVYKEISQTESHLEVMGMITDQELAPLLRGASSLLFLSPYEGFGIPVLEAMAARVPAVVANRASLPEVVGDAGIVVEPEASDEIADILLALLNNRQLRNDYIVRGLGQAQKYTWSSCAQKVLEAFNKFS